MTRTSTAIDELADQWVDSLANLEPILGTHIGREEGNDRYGDLSPEGHERYITAVRKTRDALDALAPADAIDEVTKADLLSELDLELEFHDAQWHLRDLNVIASAAQDVRQVYDLMPTGTTENWEVIARRLAAVPEALRGYAATLREGIGQGVLPARRQVIEVASVAFLKLVDGWLLRGFVLGFSSR